MKRVISLFSVLAFILCTFGMATQSMAQGATVTQRIASESVARDIASSAGGSYVEGAAVPSLSGTEVALPVMNDAGGVMGHIVAEQASLVEALNAAGLAEVSAAIAAAEVGTTAGLAVGAGITAGTVALGAAGTAGLIALIAETTEDGEGTTAHHGTPAHP